MLGPRKWLHENVSRDLAQYNGRIKAACCARNISAYHEPAVRPDSHADCRVHWIAFASWTIGLVAPGGRAQVLPGPKTGIPCLKLTILLDYMEDQVYNIAEAKMHLSKLIERVERGERITIARNNRPVAVLSPAVTTPQEVLARIDGVRERVRERNGGRAVLQRGETWHDLVEESRRA